MDDVRRRLRPGAMALLAATVAGWYGAIAGHHAAILHAAAVAAGAPTIVAAPYHGVVAIAVVLAGAYTARRAPAHGVEHALIVGAITGAWTAAGEAGPTAVAWAWRVLISAAEIGVNAPETARDVAAWAAAAAIAGTVVRGMALVVAGACLGGVGALLGRGFPSPRALGPVPGSVTVRAATAVLSILALTAVSDQIAAVPVHTQLVAPGARPWADPRTAVRLWELACHALAALTSGAALRHGVRRGSWPDLAVAAATFAVAGVVRADIGGGFVDWLAPGVVWFLWILGSIPLAGLGDHAPAPQRLEPVAAAAWVALTGAGWLALVGAPVVALHRAVEPWARWFLDPDLPVPQLAPVLDAGRDDLLRGSMAVVGSLVAALAAKAWADRSARPPADDGPRA